MGGTTGSLWDVLRAELPCLSRDAICGLFRDLDDDRTGKVSFKNMNRAAQERGE